MDWHCGSRCAGSGQLWGRWRLPRPENLLSNLNVRVAWMSPRATLKSACVCAMPTHGEGYKTGESITQSVQACATTAFELDMV